MSFYEALEKVTEESKMTELEATTENKRLRKSGLYTKNGLLYRDNIPIYLPAADDLAKEYGYAWAEQLVKALDVSGYNAVRAEQAEQEINISRKVSNAIMEIGVNE